MGAKMPAPHQRFFNLRNPFSRCVILAVALIIFLGLTFRSDRLDDVTTQIIKAATPKTKGSTYQQQPIGDTPVASEADVVPVSDHVMDCNVNPDHLNELKQTYDLQDGFEYLKRYVKINREPIPRKSITKLTQEFLPQGAKFINSNYATSYGQENCLAPLQVPVSQSPFPATGNLSDFMFGVSTTFKRFNSSKTSPVDEWTYWLTDGRGNSNGGKLVLLLLDAEEEQILEAKTVLDQRGIDVDVYHSDSRMEMAVRYLTLVPTLYNHPERPYKKWLVTCDDDTFFPSVHALTKKFEQYDPEDMLYIGTLSEDVNNVDRHGSQAFGGAGVFLSVPLAAQITNDYDTCKTDEKIREANSGWGPQGDILLRKCIYENTDVRLSVLRGLYQLDLYGDPSGFYESGIKPISLHHFKGGGWHSALPWQYTKIAHICGEDCTLQRFQTSDDFIISTSFSVVQYPEGINFNLAQMERTFAAAPQDKGWNLDYVFDPQRPSLLKTGRKISWDLQEARNNPDNTVSQIYVRKGDDWRWVDRNEVPMNRKDGLIELVWIP
ncbi:glycosyltransferase family 31 protein [Pestalotiopsis sp. NC0098]|nr:glycosyltransferase family 31 protein [Pestalotiopsis sp. NC0098]